jgi:hypothetical protein
MWRSPDGGEIARVSRLPRRSVENPQRSLIVAFAALRALPYEFGNRIAMSNDPDCSAATSSRHPVHARQPPPPGSVIMRSTPLTIAYIGATEGRAATVSSAAGK